MTTALLSVIVMIIIECLIIYSVLLGAMWYLFLYEDEEE